MQLFFQFLDSLAGILPAIWRPRVRASWSLREDEQTRERADALGLEARATKMSKKKIFLTVFAILFGLTAGFLVTEILLRIAAPAWLVAQMKELNLARNVASFGSDVGWSVETVDGRFVRFVPNTHFDVHYYEYNHSVHIDRWGGRVVAGQKKQDVVIPFLGDSFAFGLGVEDEQTYISLLNAISPYTYLNLGVPGSALPNQLDQIEFRHKELHSPRVYVFTFFTGNDYMDIFRYYSKHATGTADKKQNHFIEWLDRSVYRSRVLGRSYVLQFLKHTVLKDYFHAAEKATTSLPPGCGRPPGTNWAVLMMSGRKKCINDIGSYVELAVDHLQEVAHRLHFVPVFVIIPDKLQVNRNLLEPKAARWNLDIETLDTELPSRLIEDQLRVHHIPYFDLSECLRGRSDLYYKADDHFTPAGHRVAAECLSQKLDAEITKLLEAK